MSIIDPNPAYNTYKSAYTSFKQGLVTTDPSTTVPSFKNCTIKIYQIVESGAVYIFTSNGYVLRKEGEFCINTKFTCNYTDVLPEGGYQPPVELTTYADFIQKLLEKTY